jgi:hypothetical protein
VPLDCGFIVVSNYGRIQFGGAEYEPSPSKFQCRHLTFRERKEVSKMKTSIALQLRVHHVMSVLVRP